MMLLKALWGYTLGWLWQRIKQLGPVCAHMLSWVLQRVKL